MKVDFNSINKKKIVFKIIKDDYQPKKLHEIYHKEEPSIKPEEEMVRVEDEEEAGGSKATTVWK